MSLTGCDVKINKDFVEIVHQNGTKKVITFEDFKHAIDKSVNIQQSQETTFLPYNCYRFGRSISEISISCYYPEQIREVRYQNDNHTKSLKIPFPNIIIHHKLTKTGDKWVSAGSSFMSTHKTLGQLGDDVPVINRDLGIWSVALPNMYANGNMCYGNNAMPTAFTKGNFRGLNWYFEVLYQAPFNNDLNVPELRLRGSDWLVELSKHKTFPYDKLPGYTALPGLTTPANNAEPVPTREGLTARQILENGRQIMEAAGLIPDEIARRAGTTVPHPRVTDADIAAAMRAGGEARHVIGGAQQTMTVNQYAGRAAGPGTLTEAEIRAERELAEVVQRWAQVQEDD